MTRQARRIGAVALAITLALATAACGSNTGSNANAGSNTGADTATKPTLTLYNAQHEDLTQAEVDAFTKETGIKVEMRNGDDAEMANQIIQEGGASPADVFVTENSPSMALLDSKGLLSPIDKATLTNVPAQYTAANGAWVGWAARSTVLVYNTKALTPDQLPASIMDLADPKWQGKIGISPSGADFQAIVSAVLQLEGEQATEAWLAGLKANAQALRGNNAVMKAVNAGQIEAGVIYHYYWYKDQANNAGANSNNTKLLFFGHQDPGAFVSVSGAGVLKSSKHQQAAQQLVEFLTSAKGQQILAESTALEYSIDSGVGSNPKLKPLSELDAPTVNVADLDGPKVVQMMTKAGLL